MFLKFPCQVDINPETGEPPLTYAAGEAIPTTPAQAAQLFIELSLDKQPQAASPLQPYAGCRIRWTDRDGLPATGLVLVALRYYETRMVLALQETGDSMKGVFLEEAAVQVDHGPLIHAIREAGQSAASDRGPVIAYNLLRTLLEDLERIES